ncbi:MAG: glycosyltransferase [Myxococcota bacterium]|nr:glycosyltransferase [Myxococcota bacterium]
MLARIYPRLTQGGAETEILHLLQAWPGTRMVVTHLAGARADEAQHWCELQVLSAGRRWESLVESMEGVHTAHLHCINHHLAPALMAQVAGVPRILQTVHNAFAPESAVLVDHQIVPSAAVAGMQDEPTLSTVVPSGVPVPKELPPFRPWYKAHRRPRLIEVRREDKEMAFSLVELVESGALGEVELWVVGVEGQSCGRVRYFGQVSEPAKLIRRCDVLVHASGAESYGRTPREAMAEGVVAAVTALPPFVEAFGDEDVSFLPSEPAGAARVLKELLARLEADEHAHVSTRIRNHTRVAARESVEVMVEAHRRLYSWNSARDRLIEPGELPDPVSTGGRLGRMLDGGTPGDLRDYGPAEQALSLWVLVQQGRLSERQVLPALERANGLLPNRFAILRDLGLAQLKARRFGAAQRSLEEACAIRPASRSAWMLRTEATLSALGPRAAEVVVQAGLEQTQAAELWRLGERLRQVA